MHLTIYERLQPLFRNTHEFYLNFQEVKVHASENLFISEYHKYKRENNPCYEVLVVGITIFSSIACKNHFQVGEHYFYVSQKLHGLF